MKHTTRGKSKFLCYVTLTARFICGETQQGKYRLLAWVRGFHVIMARETSRDKWAFGVPRIQHQAKLSQFVISI